MINKFSTGLVVLITLVTGVAVVATALRLQTTKPIAPTVPQETPKAISPDCYVTVPVKLPENTVSDCVVEFDMIIPSDTPTTAPSTTPLPTPTPTPAPVCLDLRLYNTSGQLITDYSTLRPGSSVIIMVVGANYTSARIKINNESFWRVSNTQYTATDEVTGMRFEYTFPTDGNLQFRITGEISYDGVNWQ